KAVVADRAPQLDPSQRCQDPASLLDEREREFLCHAKNFLRIKSFPLVRNFFAAYLPASFTVPVLTLATSRLGQDADQSVARFLRSSQQL
ncbi:MAG: hypothetical protein WD553_01545, partial [Gemmatimonadaceae bacterium]